MVHFWKHLKCSRFKCRRGCCNGSDDEFGEYPVVFYIYITFQLLFTMFITLIYIYDIIYYQDTAIYQYDGNNSWNSINLIPQILLYPLGKKENFSYFIKPTKLTLTDNPIDNVSSIQHINLLYTANLCILFVIYSIEVFMHWYRYYTVYVAHRYLKNFSFCKILKYYLIYMLILIFVIGISIFLQNYFGILIIILHLSFSIYCSNQQIKILYKSISASFDKQQVKLLMVPLYPTRTYSILSSISSSIFLFILIVSNTFNSIIYYPIFSCLTTLFLSLIFVRNRHFICKCCKKKDERLPDDSYYDDKHSKIINNKSKRCCLCFKERRNNNNDNNKNGKQKNKKPKKIQYTATPVEEAAIDNDIAINMPDIHLMPNKLEDLRAIHTGSSGDTEHEEEDDVVIDDAPIYIKLKQQQSPNPPSNNISTEESPNPSSIISSEPISEPIPCSKPKHSLRELPDGFHIVSPSGLIEMEQIVENLSDENIENIQQPKHSRKGTKHDIDIINNNKNSIGDELYDNLFPSMSNIVSSNKSDIATHENTVIINAPNSHSLPPPMIGMPLNTNITSTEIDLYDGVDSKEIEQSVKIKRSIRQQPESPVSPKNTPTLNAYTSSKGIVLLPTLNANIDSIQMTDVIAKLNRVGVRDTESPFNNTNVIKPKHETSQTVLTTINSMPQQQKQEKQEEEEEEEEEEKQIERIHDIADSMNVGTMNIDEMKDFVVEDDDDLFDYTNVKSPQQLMTKHFDDEIMNETEEYKYKKHGVAMSSTNDVYIHCIHENQLSMLSTGSQVSQSMVPQQRPTTAKNIKTFFDNNTSQHIQNVTLANVVEGDNEFDRQISAHSQLSHLDVTDLQQHLNLLYILKSQGLMKNPEKLLHSHQKLNKFKKQISLSQRDENKMKKYKKQKKIHNRHKNGIFCD